MTSGATFTKIESIVEYRVVESTTLPGLTAAVNERLALRAGWEPNGPLYVTMNGRYLQPLIRRERLLIDNTPVQYADSNPDHVLDPRD